MNKNDVNELPIISKQEQNFALWFHVKPVYYWQLFMHVTFFIAICWHIFYLICVDKNEGT